MKVLSDDDDKIISQTLCLQVMLSGIKNMMVQVFPIVNNVNDYLSLALLCIFAFVYLRALVYSRLNFTKISLAVIFFVMFSFLLTYLFFPSNIPFVYMHLSYFVCVCFVPFVFLTMLSSLRWLIYYMHFCSWIILVVSVILSIYVYLNGWLGLVVFKGYSLTYSYVTLIAVMWMLHFYFERKKMCYLIGAILGIVVILLYGSRNPLLAIFSFGILEFLRVTGKKHLGALACFVCVGLVLIVFYKPILLFVNDILRSYDISSRTISLLLLDEVSMSGREIIYDTLFGVLNENPLIGYGISGDQVLMGELVSIPELTAHGLYLSIFVTYGYVVGAVVLLIIMAWNYIAYRQSSFDECGVLLMYMCMVWPRGFVGGGVWGSDVFWWLLGLVIAMLQRNELDYEKTSNH